MAAGQAATEAGRSPPRIEKAAADAVRNKGLSEKLDEEDDQSWLDSNPKADAEEVKERLPLQERRSLKRQQPRQQQRKKQRQRIRRSQRKPQLTLSGMSVPSETC